MNKLKLFCLPHAGGSKYSYNVFKDLVPSYIEVIPVEYPGRGEKISDDPHTNLEDIVQAVFDEVKPHLNSNYAIWGHSMGTLVGLLLVRKIQLLNFPNPHFLCFTGSEGPSTRVHEKIRHQLSHEDLIEELKSLGGISSEILEDSSIMDFFTPIIRADFQALETYEYSPAPPLDIPIIVAVGSEEKTSLQDAQSWQKESRYPIDLMQFPGNHFFIFDQPERIIKIIVEKTQETAQY